jgi:UDP-glucose 4-epimerase
VRALVTGGAGFVGSTLVDALIREGHDVVVLDDLSRGNREQVNGSAEFVKGDINDDLSALFTRIRPEVVFHQAAQIDVRRSVSEPLIDTHINVVGTVNLLQTSVGAGVRRFVFASSGGAMYGDTDVMPTPETHPSRPASQYGAAKVCAELYGGVYSSLHGLEFTALRYANVYGPRQDPHGEAGVVAIFAERLLRGEPTIIFGDGRQTRDYTYVDDVVAANLAAIDGPPGAYNVGTGVAADVNQLHELVVQACDVNAAAQHGPARPGEQQASCLDASLAAARLGWRPQVDLSEGIRRTVAFFRDRVGAAA